MHAFGDVSGHRRHLEGMLQAWHDVLFTPGLVLSQHLSCTKITKLAENGTDIKADTISLLSRETGPVTDFRRGVIFIAIGIPVTASLLIVERYELAVLLGGVPLCVGAAFLLVIRYGRQAGTK
jgi:hypothetical protein